jgi:hypothetical protein
MSCEGARKNPIFTAMSPSFSASAEQLDIMPNADITVTENRLLLAATIDTQTPVGRLADGEWTGV